MQATHGNRPLARGILAAVTSSMLSACVEDNGEQTTLAETAARMEIQIDALPELRVGAQSHQRLGFFGREGDPAWVEVDLETEQNFEEVIVFPARPADAVVGDAGVGLPREIRVIGESASGDSRILADWRLTEDDRAPEPPFVRLPVPAASARTLRLEIRGGHPRGRSRVFSLGEVVILSGGQNIALGKPVRTSAGILNAPRWAPENLTDGFLWCGSLLGTRRSPSNGFHSRIETSPDQVPKWVEVDLGGETRVDEVRLVPARPVDFADVAGFGFPPRFCVALMNGNGEVFEWRLGGEGSPEYPNPGDAAVCLPGGGQPARRVRVTADALWQRSRDYIFALAELQVFSGGQNVARGKEVTFSDHVESASSWRPQALVDGFASQRELLPWREWLDQIELRESLSQTLALTRQRLATLDRARQRALLNAALLALAVVILIAAALLGWMHRRQAAARQLLRERIARDLHDEIGSELSHLSLLAAAGDAQTLPRIASGARDLQQVMRDLVWLLAPGSGDAREFTTRLRTSARELLEPAVAEVSVRVEGNPPAHALPLDWAREVLLFTREALTNAARHSRATRASVHLEWHEDAFVWRIEDDGAGFDENTPGFKAGSGLRNLRHRAAVLNGTAIIAGSPGDGTRVELSCPLPHGTLAH
jgi:signal transduction histidine kinase